MYKISCDTQRSFNLVFFTQVSEIIRLFKKQQKGALQIVTNELT